MTWQTFQADLTRTCGEMLIASFEAMPEERQEWLPDVPGSVASRNALDLLAECIHTNFGIAVALGGTAFRPTAEQEENQRPFTDSSEAVRQVLESAARAAEAIEALTDDDLDRTIETPMMPMRVRLIAIIPAMNMQYHNGQVSLLQLLYGDAEPHFPPFD